MPVSIATEIFAIGSLMYEILTGTRPYDDRTDEEVESLFMRGVFPDVTDLQFGSVIEKSWKGDFKSAAEILDAVVAAEKSEEL